jgi:hypothetical protein
LSGQHGDFKEQKKRGSQVKMMIVIAELGAQDEKQIKDHATDWREVHQSIQGKKRTLLKIK